MRENEFVDSVSRFLLLARNTPDAPVCTWVDESGSDRETLSYAQLATEAGSIAASLRGRLNLSIGERVLIVMPPGLDFVRAFTGCLLARLIPVPAYPGSDVDRLRRIGANAGVRAVLTDAMILATGSAGPAAYDAAVLAAEHAAAPPWQVPAASDLAFLQYTSGSTSEPKGVRITHGNLVHQLECNRNELGLGPDARAVLWVPQYHDLGLISGLISALIGNGRLYQMSPLTFLRRPAVWLEVASRVRATHIAAPNFAYGLLLKRTKPEEIARLSLASIRAVMTAAEPINARLMQALFAMFAPAGLRQETLCGAYGLAEHTVGVSVFGRRAVVLEEEAFARRAIMPSGSGQGMTISSCGRPSKDVQVRIVDPESFVPITDGIGEIWVDSPSKADGYFGMPELTAETFHARTTDASDTHEYLRTGDFGFIHDGELFVTGRLKDLMIFRGRNLYPSDVEQTVEAAHTAVRPRCSVAFAVPNHSGEDSLVVIAEVERSVAETSSGEILSAIANAVPRRHGEPCNVIVLVIPETIPKTASGKLRRRACRQTFLDGALTQPPVLVAMTSPAAAPLALPGPDTFDDSMRRLFARFVNVLGAIDHKKDGPLPAVTASGTLRLLGSAAIPPHRFFSSEATYPVLLRHTNTNRVPDDAVVNGRGAAIRILDPERSTDLHRTLLDIVTMTGRRGLVRDAAAYVRWFVGDRQAREQLAARHPSIREYFSDFWRDPSSYTAVHYHSQVSFHFIGQDGGRYFSRYRLVEATQALDTGHHAFEGSAYLDGQIERRVGDSRPLDYLRQEFSQRLEAGPVRYTLAIQLRREPESGLERDNLLDGTLEWDSPWFDVAEITLKSLVAVDVSSPLSFNAANAPRDMAVPLSRSSHDPASILHMRALVYDLSGRLRRRESLPPEYKALLWQEQPTKDKPRRRVCVIGAGPSGLTAARALEKLGHDVTVFERGPEVGGMASSVMLDGQPYDLGAHLCTGSYETVADLARELNVATEPTTGYFLYDLKSRSVVPQDHALFEQQAYERYQTCRAAFPQIDSPGLSHSSVALSLPVRAWLQENDLTALAVSMGPNYTAAGYGYLDDPELSAVYLMKFSEMIGALSPRRRLSGSWTFTIGGGFQRLWQRLAEELSDVRCGNAIESVKRTDTEVTVICASEQSTFDDIVVAIPPAEALRVLDLDAEERRLLESTSTFDYVTTVCRAEKLPELGLYMLKQNCEDRSRIGHSVAYHHRYAGSDIHLFYAYGNGRSERELDEALAEDIAAMGGVLKKIEFRRRFKYMAHPAAPAIREGFFQGVEGLQGKRHTYYTGSLLGFELVECVTSHARTIINRHFGAPDLPAMAEPAVAAPSGKRLTQAAIENWLAREIAAELDLPAAIPVDADLASFRIDSVTAAAILGNLSHWLDWSVPPYMIFDQPTVSAIAGLIMKARPDVLPAAPGVALPSPLLISLKTVEAPPPIFLVGGLMGAALYLRDLANHFPPEQPAFALQAAGLDGKEPPFGSVAAAAEAYLAAIRLTRPHGPYRFVGHSFGGLVAYEMADRLNRSGEAVQLALLDTLLFAEGEASEIPDDEVALAELLVAIRVSERPDVLPDVPSIVRLSSNALRDQVLSAISGSRPFSGEVSLARWVRVYRAHSEAMRDYRPPLSAGFRWTLLKAEAGYPSALMHPSRRRHACYDQSGLGWQRTAAHFAVKTVPGNHFTMVLGRNAAITARAILQCFESVRTVSA